MTPVPVEQRVLELDFLRGFALSGVLIVNLSYDLGPARGALDHAVMWCVHQLTSGAFYPIFSFLFGAGFALQVARSTTRDGRFEALYIRRLMVLLVFGLAHMAFLWWGDILHLYAVLGFVLLLLRTVSGRTLLICALLLWIFSTVEEPLLRMAHVNRLHITSEQTAKRLESEHTNACTRGSYRDVVAARLRWMPVRLDRILTDDLLPNVLGFFLLGAFAVRRLLPIHEHICAIRRAAVVASAVAIVTGAAVLRWPDGGLLIIFKTSLAGLYAAAVVLVVQWPAWRRRLHPLASLGRMALTNYLLQSALFTTLLYHYGFEQYKRIGPASGFGFAVVVYLSQLALSYCWLSHFRHGPLEWIWRALTYGSLSGSQSAVVR